MRIFYSKAFGHSRKGFMEKSDRLPVAIVEMALLGDLQRDDGAEAVRATAGS